MKSLKYPLTKKLLKRKIGTPCVSFRRPDIDQMFGTQGLNIAQMSGIEGLDISIMSGLLGLDISIMSSFSGLDTMSSNFFFFILHLHCNFSQFPTCKSHVHAS